MQRAMAPTMMASPTRKLNNKANFWRLRINSMSDMERSVKIGRRGAMEQELGGMVRCCREGDGKSSEHKRCVRGVS